MSRFVKGADPMAPEKRAALRQRMRDLWADPEWRAKRRGHRGPNVRTRRRRAAEEAARRPGSTVPTLGPAEILIRDHDMRPLFVLTIYGATPEDLCTVAPAEDLLGGNLVAAALRRRGIHPASVVFTMFDVNVGGGRRSPFWET